jgi:transcription initiation factor TFIIIB Brf1 subunit/transcription initiation factor TFIIB
MQKDNRLLEEPEKCPNCGSWDIQFSKFAPLTKLGEYYCDDCGWGMDAQTGKLTNKGKTDGDYDEQ